MDKIPEGAESLTVLVGGVKFLSEPVVAFVRLAQVGVASHITPHTLSPPLQSHLLGDLTEVPVPVRFIYLLLGPQDSDLDYHEVGRSMATLMSDKVRLREGKGIRKTGERERDFCVHTVFT